MADKFGLGWRPDPFFGNGAGLDRFNQALAEENCFDAQAFENAENTFHRQNITGIVLELPTAALDAETLRVWATTALWHREEQVQVNREANPLMLHLFHQDELLKQAFNQGHPHDDVARSGAEVAGLVAKVTRLAQTAQDPTAYGELVAQTLLPDVLVYRSNTPANYGFAVRNGRRLSDDSMDVALSIMTDLPFSDQVGAEGCYQTAFPYLAPPIQA